MANQNEGRRPDKDTDQEQSTQQQGDRSRTNPGTRRTDDQKPGGSPRQDR